MNIVEYIKVNYGQGNLRTFHRFYKMGIPEIHWMDSPIIALKAEKYCKMMEEENVLILGVMTEDNKLTDILVAEMIKYFAKTRIVKLIWFDVFLSDFFDKWNGVFSSDDLEILSSIPAIGIMGVTHKRLELKNEILLSFSKFIKSITKTGLITRTIIGLDSMNKEDVPILYGEEFNLILDKKILVRLN